jgi:hypothetical protein
VVARITGDAMSPRGNKSSKAVVEARREKIADIVDENPSVTQGQIAKEVGRSLSTIQDDLAILRENFRAGNKYGELVAKLVDLGIKQYEATHAGQIPPDVANACTGILRAIGKWTGAEVNRSVTAHVGDANRDSMYSRWQDRTRHIFKEETWSKVWEFVASIPPDRIDTHVIPDDELLLEGDTNE